MRPLWIHRNVENLQSRITCYLYSSRYCALERQKITNDWDAIKKEMEAVLVEMDLEAISRKMYKPKIDALSDQAGKPR
jgi:hypothetical protein